MTKIVEVSTEFLNDLTHMALELWPDCTEKELREEFSEMLGASRDKVFLALEREKAVAFIHVAVRRDYVEGSTSSPTGYVEGIYVRPMYRRKGISHRLVEKGEEWLKEKGCKEIGSDIEMDNHLSYQFHTEIGFKEVNRLIAFIKKIK